MPQRYELLLMNVIREYSGQGSAFRDSIGQHSIASFLEIFKYKAQVYSGTIINSKEIMTKELEENEPPIVGFYTAADNVKIVASIIKWLKKNYNVVTVVGGPQAIDLGIDFFNETGNDFVIVGEGEIPIKFLLDSVLDKVIPLSKVPSLVYKNEGKLVHNSRENSIIQNLDMIPFPKMHNSIGRTLRQQSMAGILTGRGCPYSCTFCYEAQSTNLRFRSIDNVMEEIDYIRQNNKILKYINIYDDTFTIDKNRVLEFCEKIKTRNISWFCEAHISFIVKHPDIVKSMVENGLICMQLGLESGSNKVLSAYNKKVTSDMMIEAVKICKDAGITSITGNFIIGGAMETRETIEETKVVLKKLLEVGRGCIDLHLVYLAAYPNTKISRKPSDYELNISDNLKEWNIYTMSTPITSTNELSTYQIYNIMQELETFLLAEYKQCALESSKTDFIQSLYLDGKKIGINPIWETLYFSDIRYKHFSNHLTYEEQVFNPERFSIRTFDNFSLKDGVLHTKYGEFEGLEKDFLLNANGKYTNNILSEKLNISILELEELYVTLNERCLVFISEF